MDDKQPSITAENIAAVRAFEAMRPAHERICNDPFASVFLTERLVQGRHRSNGLSKTLAAWESGFPGVCGSIVARTRFIDDCLVSAIENRLEQLVILGAGYDTRALRFKALMKNIRVFEIDHPVTQKYKLDKLNAISPTPVPNVTFISVNFEEENFGPALSVNGYDSARQSFFIWEGVSYYLSAKAVDNTLSFIAGNSAPGSEIVFDYFPATVAQGTCILPEALPLSRALRNFGEKIRFGIIPEEIAGFLETRGFKVIQSLSSEDYKQAYFKARASRNRRVSRLFFFVHASVA